MPAVGHWFSLTAIYIMLTVFFAVWGAKDMMRHEKQFIRYCFLTLALIFLFLGFRESAKQEETSEIQQTKNADLIATVARIEESGKKQEDQLSAVVAQNTELGVLFKKIASAANLDPNRSTKELADEIIKRLPDTEWRPLSQNEKTRLTAALRLLHPQPIVVACETANCKKLSDDLVAALHDGGWNSKMLQRGGYDITGKTGISLNPNEDGMRYLKDAIERTTHLTINIGTDSRKVHGNGPALLVVGTKPF